MLNLICFEIKKFFHTRKNLTAIALFIILTGVYAFLNGSLETQREESRISAIQNQIKSIENALVKIDRDILKFPNNQNLLDAKIDYNEEIELLERMKDAYVQKDWENYLKCKVKMDKNSVENIELGKVISGRDINEIKKDIEINSILLEKKIAPIYDSVSIQGYNFIKLVLGSSMTLIFMILVIILSADVVSSEFECNTYKLLFTQPISKNTILFSKMISMIVISNTIILLILGLFFVVLGITHGFGAINYPTELYLGKHVTYVGIGKYLLFEIVLLILLVTFICVLSTFISSLCKNSSSSISLTIIMVVATYMIINKGFISKLAHIIPFTYIDLSNTLLGNTATILKNSNINFLNAVIALTLSIILLIILSITAFRKKSY